MGSAKQVDYVGLLETKKFQFQYGLYVELDGQ